jgi:hypothetical protein
VVEAGLGLTRSEQKENMLSREAQRPIQKGSFAMSAPSSLSDHSHYEQACDQAIAMCDGNLRSTIKVLIMANEYLETELEELLAAIAAGREPASTPAASDAA